MCSPACSRSTRPVWWPAALCEPRTPGRFFRTSMPWTEPATSWPRPWPYRKTRSTWFSTPPEFAAHLQSQVTVSIGGVNVPVAYSGTQGFFTGLDQFYALPKALLGWFRGAYSWKLPLFYFGGILILVILPGAVLSGAYYLLRWKSPEALKLVRDGWGIKWGISAGIGVSVISRCAQKTRLGTKREFEQMALLYGRMR